MKLSDLNPKNEEILEEYSKYLMYKRPVKLTKDTVNAKRLHIEDFDEFCKYRDFKMFTSDVGTKYYDFLLSRELSYSTMFSYLYDIKEFLSWYFRTHKIKNSNKLIDSLETLTPRDEDIRLSHRLTYVDYPTREEFDRIIDFPEQTIADKRDKAILAFMFISCARVGAISTTNIAAVDLDKMIYRQDPLEGIQTKKKKHIITKLLPFGEQYTKLFVDWILYLKNEWSFDDTSPLFPKIRNLTKGEVIIREFLGGETEYNKMIEKRCIAAGVKKFNPHSFRHFGIFEALKYVRNGTQLRALSQNVGHELITNILEQYAKMRPEIYTDIIERMIMLPIESRMVSELSDEELATILQKRLASRNSF